MSSPHINTERFERSYPLTEDDMDRLLKRNVPLLQDEIRALSDFRTQDFSDTIPIGPADLRRSIAAGNTGSILPAGLDHQGRSATRQWGASGYGGDDVAPSIAPRVIQLSRLGRLALAWRRFWRG
jgi:hypothetical protein